MEEPRFHPHAEAQILEIADTAADAYIEIATKLHDVRRSGLVGERWIGTVNGRHRVYLLRPDPPEVDCLAVHDVSENHIVVVDFPTWSGRSLPSSRQLVSKAALRLGIVPISLQVRP